MLRFSLFRIGVVVLLLISSRHESRSADWPQWLGPTRNSIWSESGTLNKFPAGGPKILWRAAISGGYAGPAVTGGRVLVPDFALKSGEPRNDPGARPKLEGQERLVCLDAKTGKTLWTYAYDCTYEISYPAGPRATPTIDGDRVYMLGAEGRLSCLQVDSGKLVWTVDLKDRYRAQTPVWGYVSHPTIDGNAVYCLAGGAGSTVVALDKLTGKELWKALSTDDPGYCPPTIIEAQGKKQLVVWEPKAVHGLDPRSGREHWKVDLVPEYGMSINAPRQAGDLLFVGGIYDKAVLLRLTAGGTAVEEVWRATNKLGIGPVHSPPVIDGNYLYGVDNGGELTAVELATGKRLWQTFQPTTGSRRANSGTGFLVKNGDKYFIFSETGALVIARLTPDKYEELDRAQVLEPTHEAFGRLVAWSHPAFADRTMYARNNKEVVCVSLAE